MKSNQYVAMGQVVKTLQSKSNFSTKMIADLLLLDLQHNNGKVITQVEMLLETMKTLSDEGKNET